MVTVGARTQTRGKKQILGEGGIPIMAKIPLFAAIIGYSTHLLPGILPSRPIVIPAIPLAYTNQVPDLRRFCFFARAINQSRARIQKPAKPTITSHLYLPMHSGIICKDRYRISCTGSKQGNAPPPNQIPAMYTQPRRYHPVSEMVPCAGLTYEFVQSGIPLIHSARPVIA